MANKLKQLRAQRDSCHERLTDLEEFAVRASNEDILHHMFKIRFIDIENIREEFFHQHSSLLAALAVTENPDFGIEKEIVARFDNSFYTIKSIYHTLFDESQSTQNGLRQPNVRLPKIDVPKFDGNINDWPTFINLFRSLIHNNGTLSNSEKFQFLLMSLSKNPLSIVKAIPLTDENYAIAFKTLTDRYQNTRLLASSYWRQITEAPKLKSKSPSALRDLLDRFTENLDALRNLKLPVEHWNFIMFHILCSKLDEATVTRFELDSTSTDIPSYEDLVNFLLKQCTAYETVALTITGGVEKSINTSFKAKHITPVKTNSSCFVNALNSNKPCLLCPTSHPLYKCSIFLDKEPIERYNVAKQNRLCLNCLKPSHRSTSCQSKFSCRICQAKHHTLLHFNNNTSVTPCPNASQSTSVSNLPSTSTSKPLTSSDSSNCINSLTNLLPKASTVLLSTAVIEMLDIYGNFQKVRVLLDSASQASFITEKCVKRLGLPRSRLSLSIQGLGEMSSQATGNVIGTVRPLGQNSPNLTIEAIILPKICGLMPPQPISNNFLSNMSNIQLADDDFNTPGEVDLLLGADIFPLILKLGQIKGNETQPSAINTIFGWILMGKVSCSHTSLNSFHVTSDFSLDQSIKKFWELEEIPKSSNLSPEDLLCEKIFVDTHSRHSSGRYIVKLPFKDALPSFLDSRDIALRRFYSLERRLLQDSSLYNSYSQFMRDYLDNGHMEEVIHPIHCDRTYYIPHHSVIKPDSTTTQLRVVFDASCRSSDGGSLNENLLVGPKLQNDITTILLNFRLHQFVFIADIMQMYRQILVHADHRDYQRILWRFSPVDPIKDFCLNTVTFGVSSAPYLALRTLIQLAHDEGKQYPRASKVLLSDIYVDDVVTGCDSLEDALLIQKEIISLLKRGGFILRKWASNNPSLLESIPREFCYDQDFSFQKEEHVAIKVLGLKWLPSSDSFSFNVTALDRPCTKRTILSELARIFDPIGFLTPLSFFAKFLIQYLWTLGLKWDQPPPNEVLKQWNQYKRELPLLSSISISRCLIPSQFVTCDLHGFCDSSEKGYAAVIYLRFICPDNRIIVSFGYAKSKVAPLKRISIPRLELCAAVLLSNLITFLKDSYSGKLHFDNIYAWSDSTVVLSWVKSSPHRWKTFVSNRVSHIQERVTPESWHHVRSGDNPADCASRGLMPQQLLEYLSWWAGPPWLHERSDLWPSFSSDTNVDPVSILEEERKVAFSTTVNVDTFDILLEKFSSLSKIQRIITYCHRFYFNLRNPGSKRTGSFSADDLHQALRSLVKYSQQQYFQNDIKNLLSKKLVSKPLRKLNPFLDRYEVLRVGGRLINSNLLFEQKHPMLLPRDCRLTTLIIEQTHLENLHPGIQTLQYLLFQNFWILSPKRAIHSVLSNCYKCFRTNPKSLEPFMGNLPSSRITQLKPFSCVGVDFGGPFIITLGKHRGAKTHKAYLCLFICFSTKAVHLELASDLSSEAFLATLRRFIARRGRCSHIFSDCGTNFVGASKYIAELMQTVVEEEKITWSFNPPSAPHFGGLWEAGIKSVKSHLSRVIGQQILTYEELSTLFVQIEALLNSRPLCPLSSDPNDLQSLTPGHFLTLEPLTTLPDRDLTNLKINRLTRWQLLQQLHQHFWKRWHQEYLHTLMQRNKWNKPTSPVSPGTLVLIKENMTTPLNWRLGRIERLHPGKDGISRVASVQIGKGIIQRPLVKLCPLPNQ